MTSHIPSSSRIARKTLLAIRLGFFSVYVVASTLNAQGTRGVPANAKIVVCQPGKKPKFADAIVNHPRPISHLPAERPLRHQGSGIFRLTIDCKTGLVTDVIVEKSIGFKTLDDTIIKGLSQWRWKPGTWREVAVPVAISY